MNRNPFSSINIDKDAALPRYRQVAEQLAALAAGLPEGSRLPSDSELVKMTGLSLFTVRQAVNELVKAGIAERQHGKGTFLKPGGGASGEILLFIDEKVVEAPHSSFYTVLFHHLIRALAEHQLKVKMVYLDNPASIIDKAFEFRGKGYRKAVFLFPEIRDEYRMLDRMLNLPVVFIDHYVFGENTACVVSANRKGGRLGAEYLRQRGCRTLAFFGDDQRRYNYEQRGEGFIEAAGETDGHPEACLFREAHLLADAAAAGKFDGIMCCSDHHTILLLEELRKRRIDIPGNVSLISYDGTAMLAGCQPEMTAVKVDLKDMAEKVCAAIARDDTGFILECRTGLSLGRSTR